MGGESSGRVHRYEQPDEETPCEELEFSASVSSPQADAVERLAVDDVLAVAERDEGGTRPVVLLAPDGAVVGALLTRVEEVRRCLAEGHAFEAVVTSVQGGSVTVHVRPA